MSNGGNKAKLPFHVSIINYILKQHHFFLCPLLLFIWTYSTPPHSLEENTYFPKELDIFKTAKSRIPDIFNYILTLCWLEVLIPWMLLSEPSLHKLVVSVYVFINV